MLTRTITADGRIKFPSSLLETMQIDGNTKVFITTNGDEIVLRKVDRICELCNSEKLLIKGFPICRPCAEKAADLLKLS